MNFRKLQKMHLDMGKGVDINKALKSGGLTLDKPVKKEKKWTPPNMKGFKYGAQTGM